MRIQRCRKRADTDCCGRKPFCIKEAVSQWLSSKSFPRPNKLLHLGKLLNLSFSELVIHEEEFVPKVAFRKMRGTKTREHHVEKAQEIGIFLRNLVPYLGAESLRCRPFLNHRVVIMNTCASNS